MQPDLCRGDRAIEKLGDLGIAELVDVVQEDDRPILVRQGLEIPLHAFRHLRTFEYILQLGGRLLWAIGRVRLVGSGSLRTEGHCYWLPAPQTIEAYVGRDPVEPGQRSLRVAEFVKALKGACVAVLCQLFRIGSVSHKRPDMALDQRPIGKKPSLEAVGHGLGDLSHILSPF